jgi:hypothetical protein
METLTAPLTLPQPASMPTAPPPPGLQSPPAAIVHPGRASWFVRRVVA